MSLTGGWWCCAEYARTGAQHDEACEYALLGDRADVLVRVKADYARLAHQHRGAVGALREVARLLDRSTQTGKAPTQDEWAAALALANATLDRIEGQ